MKKVLFYCHVYYPENSGYANAFQNTVNTLLDSDHDLQITVITPYQLDNNEEIKRNRLKIIRLHPKISIKKIRYFINEFFYAKEVSKEFKSGKYDLLLVETFDQPIFLASLDNDIYIKTAVRVHSTSETEYTFFSKELKFRIRKFILKHKVIKNIKWILSTNSYHIDFVKKHYFSNNEIAIGDVSFFLLPNNVNLSENAKFDVGDKIKTFVLGRMNYLGNNQKGFTDLIYSIKSLNQKILERYEITIVGQGNMKPYLTSLCTELTNITFIDSLPHKEIIKSLEESDLIILPSRYEGLSMFALEGLATGNACIFSKTGGLMDMIHTNGIFFEPQNIESLSNALIEFSNKSKEEISNMKKASLDICKKKYSKDAIQKKFHLIYEIIANKKNHKHDI